MSITKMDNDSVVELFENDVQQFELKKMCDMDVSNLMFRNSKLKYVIKSELEEMSKMTYNKKNIIWKEKKEFKSIGNYRASED